MDTVRTRLAVPGGLSAFDDGSTAREAFRRMFPSLLEALNAEPYVGVLDADLAIRDLKRAVRLRELTGLMRAARTGFLRLFATTTVRDAIHRKIEVLAPRFGWDPSDAYSVWVEECEPWVRFVDVSDLQPTDRRVREVYALDPEDGPTAQLVRLITPDVFLSCNHHHFPGYGAVAEFHGENWSIVTVAYRDKSNRETVFTGTAFGGAFTLSVSDAAIRNLAASLARIDRRVLLGVGLLFGLALLHPRTRRWLTATTQRAYGIAHEAARTCLPPLLSRWSQIEADAAEAARVIAFAQCKVGMPRRVRDLAATVLARTDDPLPPATLHSVMADWGYEKTGEGAVQYLLRVLRADPRVFREDKRGKWFLATSVGAN